MIYIKANLWDIDADIRCITTNGDVNKSGKAVMGRGVALQAANKYPQLSHHLANYLTKLGNIPFLFIDYKLLTLPVKYHWHDKADIDLVIKSINWLNTISSNTHLIFATVIPGIGNGHLDPLLVLPLLCKLPDNVLVCKDYDI